MLLPGSDDAGFERVVASSSSMMSAARTSRGEADLGLPTGGVSTPDYRGRSRHGRREQTMVASASALSAGTIFQFPDFMTSSSAGRICRLA